MGFKLRCLAISLLFIMALNIGRYQLPYIEYNLFKGYIAKNLCVKKEIKGNCCQGKCFVEKQLKTTNENDQTTENTNNTNTKKTNSVPVVEFVLFSSNRLNINEITKLQLFWSETILIASYVSDFFVPPKQVA
jgi:hypothetical protein